MENKKFKNIFEQFDDYQKQTVVHNLRNAVFNYVWVIGSSADDRASFIELVSGYFDEFFKDLN